MRESTCVAAAERFHLYKEAQRHLDHANEFARDQMERQHIEEDVPKYMEAARRLLIDKKPDFAAYFLQTQCDTNMTNEQFKNTR